jgi:eukaryotic-like serine/threonine-protein kinase
VQTLGKYTLVRKLAAGGMAEVFLAERAGPGASPRVQVVKRILPSLCEHEEFVAMFLNEARLVAPLIHPNIIQIHELGKEGEHYFIAMELVDGANLRSLIRSATSARTFLPFGAVVRIIALACEGLAHAHEFVDDQGQALHLVHRDMSPDNLLLSREGAVKVADFGIAKAANLPNLTKTGVMKGKISYMAPEQLRDVALDRRADVFALGVVLYEALCGEKPFTRSNEVATMQAILNEEPRPIAQVRADLPPAVQKVLDRALAKNRDQRYPDCRAFQADLEKLVAGRQDARPADIAAVVNQYAPALPTEATEVPRELIAAQENVPTRALPEPVPVPRREARAVSRRAIPVEKAVAFAESGPTERSAPPGAPEAEGRTLRAAAAATTGPALVPSTDEAALFATTASGDEPAISPATLARLRSERGASETPSTPAWLPKALVVGGLVAAALLGLMFLGHH